MAYKTRWVLPERVFMTRMEGALASQELNEVSQLALDMAEQGTPLVHHVIILENVTRFPTKVNELTGGFKTSKKMGWLVTVAHTNPLIQFLGTVVTQIWGAHLKIFATLPEAVEFLNRVDPTLNNGLNLDDFTR